MTGVDRMHDAGLLARRLATSAPGDCPYTLLLGAGASVSSGIPSAQTMIDMWRQQTCNILGAEYTTSGPYASWLRDTQSRFQLNTEYSCLFSYLYPTPVERQAYIEQLTDGGQPLSGYLFLSRLVRAGRFDLILTTNFDDLIVEALTQSEGLKPLVCSFDSRVGTLRIASRRPKVVKLHGDFLYDHIRNIPSMVRNVEEKLWETCRGGLIVAGYGGADESVMQTVRHMLQQPDHLRLGLHWCLYHPLGAERDSDVSDHVRALWRDHPDRVFVYNIKSFDAFMMDMCEACDCSGSGPTPRPDLYRSAFISYGGPDELFARRLCETLQQKRVRCFLFTEHAIPGAKLHRTVRKGIAEYDRVILICSRASLNRKGVLTELEETLDREHRDGEHYLIPIRLDDYVFNGWKPKNPDVAQAVRDRVVADFTGADQDEAKLQAGLLKLISALRK